MDSKEILKVFNFRHACKVFNPERKIPAADFDCIMEAARLSPSSFGMEPWHFLVLQNRELRAEMLPLVWGGARQIPSCSHLVVTLVKKEVYMHWGSEYIHHMEVDVHHLPPELIAVYDEHIRTFEESDFELLAAPRLLTNWAAHQTYIALGNMLTAAALLGIDSCPMEGFRRRDLDAFLAQKKLFEPDKYTVAYLAAFGYRQHEPRPKTRQKASEIITVVE